MIIGVCGLLMLVILIQRGRGSGLAGAFGGAGGSSAFGAKTGDVLTWITIVVTAVFLLLAVVANYAFDQTPEPPEPVSFTKTITIPPAELEPAEAPAPAPGSTGAGD